MRRKRVFVSVFLAAGLTVFVAWVFSSSQLGVPGSSVASAKRLRPAVRAPRAIQNQHRPAPNAPRGEGALFYRAQGPSPIQLADVPKAQTVSTDGVNYFRGGRRIESRFTDEEIAAAQEAARRQKKSDGVENPDGSLRPVGKKLKLLTSFDAIDT